MGGAPPLVPAATAPRLQSGDLLLIGSRQCRVRTILKKTAVCNVLHGGGRDFSVTPEYALAHRCKAPRLLSHTNILLAALRKGVAPPSALFAAAAAEGHLDAIDKHGSAALLLAATRGLTGAVHALLRFGARVDLADLEDGETSLMKAARLGHVAVLEALLQHGATADATTLISGYTALLLAAAAGRHACCELLLRHGASVQMRERCTRERADAMRLACVAGHLAVAKLLAGYGAALPLTSGGGGGILGGPSAPLVCGGGGAHGGGGGAGGASPLLGSLAGGGSGGGGTAMGLWLRSCARYTTPLHFLDGLTYSRARELLRDGADVHACGELAGDPTPLDVAAALGATPGDGTAGGACLAAALPWSPATHGVYPSFERAWAVELLRVGYLLAARYCSGSGGGGYALVEIWRDVILPSVVMRDGGELWPRTRAR